MSVGTEGSGPNPRTYSRAEYAALEAENARLIAMLEDWEADANLLEKERDAALAQLAAIQGGMGEEPLVVATAILGGLFHGGSGPELSDIDVEVCTPHLEKIQCETVDSSDDVFMPLMTVAQHQRITAAMAAEVERLKRENANIRVKWTEYGRELEAERDALRAELAEVKGREAVLYVNGEHLALALDNPCKEGRSASTSTVRGHYCDTPLYASPPASPDVEGLVNELQRIAEKCSDPDTTDALDTAISTWRQAQEGKP